MFDVHLEGQFIEAIEFIELYIKVIYLFEHSSQVLPEMKLYNIFKAALFTT